MIIVNSYYFRTLKKPFLVDLKPLFQNSKTKETKNKKTKKKKEGKEKKNIKKLHTILWYCCCHDYL